MSGLDTLSLVDRDQLAKRLAEVIDVSGGLDLRPLSGGHSNLTYLVTAAGREYVVRRRPNGPVPAGAHDMHREYTVLHALSTTSLPIPRVHGYWDDESAVGAPAYVMDRVHGVVLHSPADAEGIDAEQAAAISQGLVEVLAQLHAVDVAAVGLGDLGKPEGFVARRIGRWLDQWQRSEHRELPPVEGLAGQLSALVPAYTDSTLIHGDYRLGNVLLDVQTRPARVSAVLDWEMSTLGDPLTDLAHLIVYWDRQRGRLTHESQLIAELPGFATSTELAQRYAERSGRSVEHIDFYVAFEHWRAAIIKEGIFNRSQRNGAPDHAIGDSVAVHLDVAADIVADLRSKGDP